MKKPTHGGQHIELSSDPSPSFFVSYATRDQQRATRLSEMVEAMGFRCFLDKHDIEPGEQIDQRIKQGIIKCSHFLLVLSPASYKSQWVHFELGAAWALGRKLVTFLQHPAQDLLPILQLTKYVTSVAELRAYLKSLKPGDRLVAKKMPPVDEAAQSRLYYFAGGYARAVRLFGADTDFVTEDRVRIRYKHEPFKTTPDVAERARAFVKKMERDLRARRIEFFNGPNVRLMNWKAGARGGRRAALEEKVLELDLGPVGWYDYEGCNGVFREDLDPRDSLPGYRYYTGLDRILDSGDLTGSRLSNIVDTATTILTVDGYIAYSVRGKNVVLPDKLTSCVAENMNRYFDDADPADSKVLAHVGAARYRAKARKDVHYRPTGVPHPFATVRRGVFEELSPSLVPLIGTRAIKLSGVSFDLLSAHPDLLFTLALPIRASELEAVCHRSPGTGSHEGRIQFLRCNLEDPETQQVLRDDKWLPGGLASVIRCLELVGALMREHGEHFGDVFKRLEE